MTTIDPRTIAADIMCSNARDITPIEIHAHIGQAYDEVDAEAADVDTIVELIATAGIDLIWPDGGANTELDAARVEIERLRAELAEVRAKRDAYAVEMESLRAQLSDANRRADGVENDQRALIADKTALANERDRLAGEIHRLRAKLADLGKPADADHWARLDGTCWSDCPACETEKAGAAR